MHGFAFMSWDREALREAGLPEIDYPVPIPAFAGALQEGAVPPEQLLAWLQAYVAHDAAAWRTHWEPMSRIAMRLAAPRAGPAGRIEGARWRLLLAPVDLTTDVVTIQRSTCLIAALAPGEEGWLMATHYLPLDSRAAELLISSGQRPASDGTVCFRPDAFEYLKDQTAAMGQWYAFERGDAYLAYWPKGLGVDDSGAEVSAWIEQRTAPLRPWQHLAAELAAQALFGEAASTWKDDAVKVTPEADLAS